MSQARLKHFVTATATQICYPETANKDGSGIQAMKERIMRPTKAVLALVVVLLALLSSAPACAWGGHHGPSVRFGVVVGGPLWYGPAYYPPYYYPPYYAPLPVSPPVYIEQGEAQPAPAPRPREYWYYCAEAKGYYPYVKECPGGWQRVAPQPPPG
jgi:hypothetical protein